MKDTHAVRRARRRGDRAVGGPHCLIRRRRHTQTVKKPRGPDVRADRPCPSSTAPSQTRPVRPRAPRPISRADRQARQRVRTPLQDWRHHRPAHSAQQGHLLGLGRRSGYVLGLPCATHSHRKASTVRRETLDGSPSRPRQPNSSRSSLTIVRCLLVCCAEFCRALVPRQAREERRQDPPVRIALTPLCRTALTMPTVQPRVCAVR